MLSRSCVFGSTYVLTGQKLWLNLLPRLLGLVEYTSQSSVSMDRVPAGLKVADLKVEGLNQ